MSILGNYVLFCIFMMGMTLADNNEYQQFYQEMLELHNECRRKHGVGPLILDKDLCEEALRIAKAEDEGQLFTCHNENIGYNVLYEDYTTKLNARMLFNVWYEERQNYSNKDDIDMRDITSSFTQIVWKFTSLLGVAVYPGENYVIIVATYSPRGDVVNQYNNNVVAIANPEDDSSSSSGNKKQRTVY